MPRPGVYTTRGWTWYRHGLWLVDTGNNVDIGFPSEPPESRCGAAPCSATMRAFLCSTMVCYAYEFSDQLASLGCYDPDRDPLGNP